MTQSLKINVKERSNQLNMNTEMQNIHLNVKPESGTEKWINKKGRENKLFKIIKQSHLKNYLNNFKSRYEHDFVTQQNAFRCASYMLLIAGFAIGLNPVTGALGNDTSKIRFEMKSKKHFYSVIICFFQSLLTLLCILNIFKKSITVLTLANVTFYGTTFITSVLFQRLARKWQGICKEVASCRLDKYIDPCIQFKCSLATILMFSMALFEHALSIISRFAHLTDCVTVTDIHKSYMELYFDWLSFLNIPYNVPAYILVTFLNLVCTLNWNYSHLFIICISLYLSSVLEQINKKLLSSEGQFLPSSFWKELREDYSSATRLVRIFDDHINTIIFVSFASNLFFVCLQLFYILSNGVNFTNLPDKNCPNFGSGLFFGYEYMVYMLVSVLFVIGRSLSVALIASRVHSATQVAAPVLYAVPSPVYCVEVQRFIEQVHGDSVALTGMNFFQVTRQLVLSVAGTIVTYELVLLQFT